MSSFDRWKPYEYQKVTSRTIPFLRFKKFHTELNDFYWSSKAAVQAAYSTAGKYDKSDSISNAFSIKTSEYGYREMSLERWSKLFKDFHNWTRLHALMSFSAYFEYYLQAVTILAIESNPGCLLDANLVVDGCKLLKNRDDYSFLEQTIPFVKGEWASRKSAFVKTFGDCPRALEENMGELDKMRILRNNVGHTFGRDVDVQEMLNTTKFVPMQRLSENRLKKWMGLIYQIAHEIDIFLQENFIGSYDIIRTYHKWFEENSTHLPSKGHPNSIRAQTVKSFQRYYHEGIVQPWGGVGVSKGYMKNLVDYYNNL